MRRRHELHGVREWEDGNWPFMITLDESLRDSADEFIALAHHFAGLDGVCEGGRAKVDGIVVPVETGWVEVATWVWKGLAAIDVYADRVASGILVRHCELRGMTVEGQGVVLSLML